MIDGNASTNILYEKSAKQSDRSHAYHTTHRVFVPDPLLHRPWPKFVPMAILVLREGIEPPSLLCKSRALPLDERS